MELNVRQWRNDYRLAKLHITEMYMLRWVCKVTRKDVPRIDCIRGKLCSSNGRGAKKKKKECVWYGLDSGHVQLRFETSLERSIEVLLLQGTMERENPLKTLIVAVRKDMIDNGVTTTIFVWTSWCTGLFKVAVICLCPSYMVVYRFSSLGSFCCPLLLLSLLYCTFECININWAQLSLLMSMTIVFPVLF